MYKELPILSRPVDIDVKIWRFMDFTKYVSMLSKRCSYFCRADLIGDPFEGAFSKHTIDNLRGWWVVDEDMSNMMVADAEDKSKNYPKFHYLNCWHVNEYESAAMWKLYTNTNQAISIQSTFRKFTKSFWREKSDVYVGLVKYIDYDNEEIPTDNVLYPYFYKRKSFEHERELRAIISNIPGHPEANPSDMNKLGLYAPTDLEILIDKISIAPSAPLWFKDLVKSVTSKYGLKKSITDSKLDERPIY